MFGMEFFSAAGVKTYSTSDVTWNQVDFFEVPGGGDVWRSYPVISGREVLTAQIMIDPPPLNRRALAHYISVSGTVIHVAGGTERTFILLLMR